MRDRLRSGSGLTQQERERGTHGLFTHGTAAGSTEFMAFVNGPAAFPRTGEMDQADRLAHRPAARTGNPGGREGPMCLIAWTEHQK